MKITKKEIAGLKREIKNATNLNIKDIESIEVFGENFIRFGYYKNSYDRAINNMTIDEISR